MTETCRACNDHPAPNAYICQDCGDQLHGDLAAIPQLAAELELESSRQARKGCSLGVKARSAETPMPYNIAAADALERLRFELVNACLTVSQGQRGGLPPDRVTTMCVWLTRHERSIALLEQAGEICRGIRSAIRRGQRVIDNPPERRYIGDCLCYEAEPDPDGDTDEERAGRRTRLYARMGEPVYQCPRCGRPWIVAERFAQLQEDLADYGLTQRELETLLPNVPRATLHRWIHGDETRGQKPKLRPSGTTAEGVDVYRYGDVLALDAQRREKNRVSA